LLRGQVVFEAGTHPAGPIGQKLLHRSA